MSRVLWTLLVLLAVAGIWFLMWRAWRRRGQRFADLPVPPAVPDDLPPLPAVPMSVRLVTADLAPPMSGMYLGTTAAGDWLDRVAVHGLGLRTSVDARLVPAGVVVRKPEQPFLIPTGSITGVRVDEAQGGRWVGAGQVLVVTWRHGARELDTGLRPDDAALVATWAAAITRAVDVVDPTAGSGAAGSAAGSALSTAGAGSGASGTSAGASAEAPAGAAVETAATMDGAVATRDVTAAAATLDAIVETSDATAAPTPAAPIKIDPLTAPLDEVRAAFGPAPVRTRTSRPAPPATALLVLEDGRTFHGDAYGAVGVALGEAVFNTGMTGYQETLTDPSYHRQVVVMTAPHIGNTGANDEDPESSRIWVAGYVVRDPARVPSSWRSRRTLDAALGDAGVVGISGVDTRALTRHLRERGAMRVGVASEGTDPDDLLARVLASPGMLGADLAREVSTPKPYVVPAVGERRFRVVAVDLGIKASTPRYLAEAGCEVHVVPAATTAADVLALDPDGVFFSNGPGDPATADYAVDTVRGVLDADVPVFGICFGNQVLGRALGLGTYKLGYGHRGVNQPVQDRRSGRVHVTSHNHGFAVEAPLDGTTDTPYGRVEVSHVCLNDDVVEGLRCLDARAFSVQYHPEAAPGPHDATGLFPAFCDLMAGERVGG